MTAYRLSTGGLVNRSRPLSFKFDGKDMRGLEGDTLAAALLANDQLLVARSFKYHRPRGILTAGSAADPCRFRPARSRARSGRDAGDG